MKGRKVWRWLKIQFKKSSFWFERLIYLNWKSLASFWAQINGRTEKQECQQCSLIYFWQKEPPKYINESQEKGGMKNLRK